MTLVRWGMIGAGDVAEVKSGPAFNKVAHSKLVMVMRRNPDKVRDYAERHRSPSAVIFSGMGCSGDSGARTNWVLEEILRK